MDSGKPKKPSLLAYFLVTLSVITFVCLCLALSTTLKTKTGETDGGQENSSNDFTLLYTFNGEGKGTTDIFSLDAGIVRIKWTHIGELNFALQLNRLDTGSEELLENTYGNADGQKIFRVERSDQYVLEAYFADGPWTVTVEYKPR